MCEVWMLSLQTIQTPKEKTMWVDRWKIRNYNTLIETISFRLELEIYMFLQLSRKLNWVPISEWKTENL